MRVRARAAPPAQKWKYLVFKIEKNAAAREEWNVLEAESEATPGEFADGKAEDEAQSKIFDSLVSKCGGGGSGHVRRRRC